eukprot:GHVT01061677.1.p1 GENE.GHVT01061677.1~~GHVT01061677.1.p1  ORF type:complete len:131 (-),score=19.18 GHVT01061677.1:1159-1551(-)
MRKWHLNFRRHSTFLLSQLSFTAYPSPPPHGPTAPALPSPWSVPSSLCPRQITKQDVEPGGPGHVDLGVFFPRAFKGICPAISCHPYSSWGAAPRRALACDDGLQLQPKATNSSATAGRSKVHRLCDGIR